MSAPVSIELPGGFIIEDAVPEDIDELEALENVCFPKDPWSRNMLLEELESESAFFIVIRDSLAGGLNGKGRIAGYLVAWMIPPLECQIGSIAVLPEHRRSGFAAEMLKALVCQCLEEKICDIFLEVRVSNTPAIELYKKFFFEITGTRRDYYSDGEAAYNMARLGENAGGRIMR